MKRLALFVILAALLIPASATMRYDSLKQRLESFIRGKDARLGVAVIVDGRDTIEVNGRRDFPMLSVYKFPQAIALADYCTTHGLSFTDTLHVGAADLKADTYSPLRDKYGIRPLDITIDEVLAYSLQLSDNNACDILFGLMGGPAAADSMMHALGFDDIKIATTEDDMHRDPYLCYLNRCTPIAMAGLLDIFNTQIRNQNERYGRIATLMETCDTGTARLPAGIDSGKCVLGHKTGTGFVTADGRLGAVNDAGYVNLPDGRRYTIAIFVADSAYNMAATEAIIAEISKMVAETVSM